MSETNYAVAPGEFLAEWMSDEGFTQQQIADRLGRSRKYVNDLVNGRVKIDADLAVQLARLTPITTEVWLRHEAAFRADLARLHDEAKLAEHFDEVVEVGPYLRRLGATKADSRNPGRLVADFLQFHRFGTWEAYEDSCLRAETGEYALAALHENRTRKDAVPPALVFTWLRSGELTEAYERGRRFAYDERELRNQLPELRRRAARPDGSLLSDLAIMLGQVGVVLVLVPPPANFPVHGMTRWIDDRVPVIQQTGRRAKDGFIIWALFHEIGHILNDPRGELHLDFAEGNARISAAEKGANDFARSTLFGPEGVQAFDGLLRDGQIRDKAREVGVAPGVAVKELHRMRKLPARFGNRLMVDLGVTKQPE